ncbi:MAG: oligoendopeptidase F [Acholeplasmatales bacterium]|jgi:oligoendopeptidase F|nr:oligoendopeptidase F [Acholeplasmatales bacterium]
MNLNWDLTIYYKTPSDWEKDYLQLYKDIEVLKNYKGKLNKAKFLKEYFLKSEELEKRMLPLIGYAHQSSDLDLRNIEASGRMQQISAIYSKWGAITSFVSPELISTGQKKVSKMVNKDLKEYSFKVAELFHNQAHVLDSKAEEVISNYNTVSSAVLDTYHSLYDIDRINEKVILSDKSEHTISLSTYRKLLEELKNQDDRRLVFEAAFKRFKDNKSAFSSIYNSILLDLQASYKSRNYKSALEAALDKDDIPVSLFISLKDVARENTSPIKRYINLRKKYLKIKEYHTYDRFIKLASSNTKYNYEDARELFFEAISGFPQEYIDHEKEALKENYVDVLPRDGKRSGAYSTAFYGYHPFILLNHLGTLDSVFTLAHEAGHSAHSIFSSENQPYVTSEYKIFVAEIASTFNEHLLLDYLLEKSIKKEDKISLLEMAIDNIMSTFYRQTLFATYEYEANKLLEDGKAINDESLSKIMIDLYKDYYDIDISKEDGKQYVWAYIPHLFNSPFYVYQYATSFSASLKFYENVKQNKNNAFKNYLDLLKSGGSDFPVSLVFKAGVDLTDKETFLAVINRFNELLDILENLLSQK